MDAPGIAASLKSNPVYIADGLPPTTGADISSLLSANDGIKVVVLTDGQPVESVAKSVLATQPDGTTLLVVSGDDVTAVANAIPSGTISDLLARSQNVSTNGIDTVRTMVGNVHDWQAAHPQTITSSQQPHDPLLLVPIAVVSPVVVVVLVGAIVFRRRSRRLSRSVKGTGPRTIRPLIGDLMEARTKISGVQMRDSIERLCEYVEAYFKRVKSDELAVTALESQLRDALQVARTYRDIEQNTAYFRAPTKSKAEGRAAIDGLASSVLESVRSANARKLVDYSVSTKILDAQRYR